MIGFNLGECAAGKSGGSVIQWEEDGVSASKGSMCNFDYNDIYVTVWPSYKGWKNVIGMIDGKNIDCIKRFILYNLPFDVFEELLIKKEKNGFRNGSRAKVLEIREALDL